MNSNSDSDSDIVSLSDDEQDCNQPLRKVSSKKTFTSISVKVEMEDPDAVITIYKQAQKIKGLITL